MNSVFNLSSTLFHDCKDNWPSNLSNYSEKITTSHCSGKSIAIKFDGESISSDAGILLLKEVEKQTGIIDSFASEITDERDKRYVKHNLKQLLTQRIFQIACGYEDANDCNALKNDPVFKLCADKLPETDAPLASQPTMSRFENSISMKTNYLIAEALAGRFIASYVDEPEIIVIDFDDTDDTVHGAQQEALFNGYFGEYCFMPLHVYEGLSGRLITSILKPGKRLTGKAVLAILKRLIAFIRLSWKNTFILFRGDSHFSSPEMMRFINAQENAGYVTGLAGYPSLSKSIETTVKSAKNIFQKHKRPVKLYHSFLYQAASWDAPQKVVAKVEVNDKGLNTRFIVTNMMNAKAKPLYENAYCKRGSTELYIKNHKTYLKSDRTSCHSFAANQFRLLLHSAAYVLIHSLQREILATTEFANATMQTIQLKLLKIGARVKELKTKINIVLPLSYPHRNLLCKAFAIFQCLKC